MAPPSLSPIPSGYIPWRQRGVQNAGEWIQSPSWLFTAPEIEHVAVRQSGVAQELMFDDEVGRMSNSSTMKVTVTSGGPTYHVKFFEKTS